MPMQPQTKQPSSKPQLAHPDHQAQLEEYLRALKLPMFLHHYQTYAQDAARAGLSCERYLLALCQAEWSQRAVKRSEHAIKMAKFPCVKEISTYDVSLGENLPKARILELAEGGYLNAAETV